MMWFKQKSYSSAKKTKGLDGKIYDSLFEAGQANMLYAKKQRGEIEDYETQVEFPLTIQNKKGDKYKLGIYIADFLITHNDGTQEILEAKGFVGREFPAKWKLVEALYSDDYKITLVEQGENRNFRKPKKVIEW